jgi:hypothetical protein
MRDSFPPGFWAAGSPGDPEPDGLLPAGIAESLLDGRPGVVPTDLRPLGEALAALRAAPSATEFRGEEAALAAFRSIHGFATAGPAHTVPLEIPPGMLDHRPLRARHAAPRRARGRARRPPARPSAGRRLGLASAAAAALVVIMGIVAYSGHLPEPIQSAAHVVIGAPSAQRHANTRPATPATGAGNLSGSPSTPAAAWPTASATTAAPSGSASATTAGPMQGSRQLCQAYFKNPWRPGSTSWDMSDFTKLAKAAGGPRWVLKYCLPYLRGEPWSGGHGFRFPTGFDGGSWAWPPNGEGPGPGNISTGPGSGLFGTGGETATGPAIGSVPGTGSGPVAGSASASQSSPAATTAPSPSPTADPSPTAMPRGHH